MGKHLSMKSNELNDLFDYGYKIYQNDEYFKFSIDSILLAEFVEVKKNHKSLLDLCSGNAPIPLIIHKKYGDKIDITGVELQKEIYDLGIKSINYNNINNINFYNADIKDFFKETKKKYDIITCNPPYFKKSDLKILNNNEIKAIARHEITINLEDIIKISAKMIKNKGYFYLVHRPERLADIIVLLAKYNFGLKNVQMVFNDREAPCCFILIEAIFNGKNYVKINKPLFLNEHTSYKNIFKG